MANPINPTAPTTHARPELEPTVEERFTAKPQSKAASSSQPSAAPDFIAMPCRLEMLMPLRKAIGTPIAAGQGVAAMVTAKTRPHSTSGLAVPTFMRWYQYAAEARAIVNGVKSDAT